ncbi:helix-turn-helix transcriptional regulator [Polaromonas glacialis]|uniref:helix-turn-helix transcriptional regulator n=1 Tax=Polaromonas glacialis TaxID=866564 RepID=UPI000496D61E|nr:AlpA family phage regulatory protein [Polaromonas glacialis]
MKTKQLINKKTLHTMVPLSERTIDAMEKNGTFPRRFALSARSVVWDQDDVLAWIEARKAASVQVKRPGLRRA